MTGDTQTHYSSAVRDSARGGNKNRTAMPADGPGPGHGRTRQNRAINVVSVAAAAGPFISALNARPSLNLPSKGKTPYEPSNLAEFPPIKLQVLRKAMRIFPEKEGYLIGTGRFFCSTHYPEFPRKQPFCEKRPKIR